MILRILCISSFFFLGFSFLFWGQGFFSSTKHRNAAGKACLSSVLIKPQFFALPNPDESQLVDGWFI